jgi:uncharacterized protein YjbI with pentapeptide repeats
MVPTFQIDCTHCLGLCCTALAFSRSSDFGHDKPEATPCRNLDADYSCRIHDRLRDSGYKGCTVYHCFGAGQHLSQRTFQGDDAPKRRQAIYAAFPKMVHLFEMFWYVTDGKRDVTRDILNQLDETLAALTRCAALPADQFARLDMMSIRQTVRPLLEMIASRVQVQYSGRRDQTPRDWVGKHLQERDFSGASVQNQWLQATNLSNSRLCGVNFLGADLRECNVKDADLTDALFLTQAEINAATGNAATQLPPRLLRPSHWR